MSKLNAKNNLITGEWSLSIHSLKPNYAELKIGFSNNSSVIEFNDLRFGYELKQNNNIKSYGVFPKPGSRYIKSDQEYLVSQRLKLNPDEVYILYLWCRNDGQKFEKEFEFTTPTFAIPNSDGEVV